jgi:hypothetical protein
MCSKIFSEGTRPAYKQEARTLRVFYETVSYITGRKTDSKYLVNAGFLCCSVSMLPAVLKDMDISMV